MRSIIQFKINKDEGVYVAEGMDLPIVTEANDLDELVENIKEAVSLHFEGEKPGDFGFGEKPSVLVNFEIPQYA